MNIKTLLLVCSLCVSSVALYNSIQNEKDLKKQVMTIRLEKAFMKETTKREVANEASLDFKNKIHRIFLKETVRHYRYLLNQEFDPSKEAPAKFPNKIWVFWDKGYENAPKFVKACIDSIKRHAGNMEVIVLDNANYSQYVTIPENIKKKYEDKKITPVQYSDLIRTALIEENGGLWLDASTYLTGPIPQVILDQEFFVPPAIERKRFFENIGPNSVHSYFLYASKPHQYFYKIMKNFCYEYWSNNEGSPYHFWYAFATVAIEEDQKIRSLMYENTKFEKYKADNLFDLQPYLAKQFDEKIWNKIKKFPIHKFSTRALKNKKVMKNSFIYNIENKIIH